MSDKMYYVYTLAKPDGTVFYVGKGRRMPKGALARIDMHEYDARAGRQHLRCKVIRELWSQGLSVVKRIVFQTDNEREALSYERALIMFMRGSGHLTNVKSGDGRLNGAILVLDGEEYYRGAQAARFLGICHTSFHSKVQPFLTQYRHTNRVYYKRSDLEPFKAICTGVILESEWEAVKNDLMVPKK